MTQQYTHAKELLVVLHDRIAKGHPHIRGYADAATMIGQDGANYGRAMGQVCSRIDAASFEAGLPMLALGMVRMPDGSINPESFTGFWQPWSQEIKSLASSHQWTMAQVDRVIEALDSLPTDGATALWLNYTRRESEKPGFIRYNLHRKISGG